MKKARVYYEQVKIPSEILNFLKENIKARAIFQKVEDAHLTGFNEPIPGTVISFHRDGKYSNLHMFGAFHEGRAGIWNAPKEIASEFEASPPLRLILTAVKSHLSHAEKIIAAEP